MKKLIALAAAMTAVLSGPASAQTAAYEVKAREIYARVISYRTAAGQGQMPAIRAYLIEVLQAGDTAYDFNVTRCRYAEMYRALGIPELGAVLSCGRDGALGEGFNTGLTLTRTQTIMEGAPVCDFRYRLDPADAPSAERHEPR